MVKLFLGERGSDFMYELWATNEEFATAPVACAETRGAIAATVRSRRLSITRAERALSHLDRVWPDISTQDIDDLLGLFAGALAGRHGLRALDAVHLASALSLAKAEPVVVSWDTDLRKAAAAEGLAISPA